MNETDEGSSNGDDHSSDIIIKIPRVETSDDEVIQPPPCHVSSSEESDGEDIENDTVVAGDHPLAPLHLFKKAKRKARELSKKGELELATKERIRAVAYCRLVYGNGHWQLAKAHAKLGEAYLKRKGFAQQALLHGEKGRDELLEGEAEEFRSSRISHSKDVLKVMQLVYFIIGKANFQQQDWRKCQQALKKSEISATQSLKLEQRKMSVMYVKIMESLGQVSVKLKKESAIEYYEKALQHATKIYGKTSKEILPLYQGLAGAYKMINTKTAQEMIEMRIKLAHDIFTKETEELADELYSASIDLQSFQGYDVSQNLARLERCIKIYKCTYGCNHKRTIAAQEALCTDLITDGEHEKAAGVVADVINSKTIVFGDPSQSLANSYELLASIRLTQGKTDKALKQMGKCHAMLCLVLGSRHKKTVSIAEIFKMIKKTPSGSKFHSPAERLRDRPKFNGTVGRTSLLGSTTLSKFN